MVEKVVMGVIGALMIGWAIAQVVAAIFINIGTERHEKEKKRDENKS